MRLIYVLLVTLLISSCSSTQNDYESWGEIDNDLKYSIRDRNNIPYKGVMISYYGFFGWSEPDFRFIIRERGGTLSAEYIHLKEDIMIQAVQLWDNGVRDSEIAHNKLKADRFVGNENQCSGLLNYFENTWKSIVKEAINFKPEDSDIIKLDGGNKFIFHLSNDRYQVLSFAIEDDEKHQLVQGLFKYLNEFKSCAMKS